MSDPVVLLSTGDVVGPAGGVTDNSMVLFNGTSGKLIKGNNAVVTAAGLAILDDVNAAAQRATLGLGTAATANVTTSATDTTAGRVMKVGDFGLGAAIGLGAANNIDQYLRSGFYTCDLVAGTLPAGVTSGGHLTVSGTGVGVAVQCFVPYFTPTRSFIRTWVSPTWTAWVEIALTNSPAFIGTPTAPTASAGTNTQQLASTAFVQAAVGVGNVSSFAMVTPPTGWLKANGATVNRATYAALFTAIGTTFGAGDGSTTFNLPDLRGEFLRGWDDGRGLDANRLFGTAQMDALQGHWHGPRPGTTLAGSPGNWNGAGGGANGNYNIGSTGDPVTDGVNGAPRTAPETRPRNVALLYCIKY